MRHIIVQISERDDETKTEVPIDTIVIPILNPAILGNLFEAAAEAITMILKAILAREAKNK